MSTRILIVDDHDVVRQGVCSLLSTHSDWEICGEASSGAEAISAVSALKPDVVILDITMPGMSGLDAAARIAELGTGARILIFTMHESRRMADDIREAGAQGYVQKSQAGRDLIVAVERLLAGNTFFPTALDARQGSPADPDAPDPDVLFCSGFCFA